MAASSFDAQSTQNRTGFVSELLPYFQPFRKFSSNALKFHGGGTFGLRGGDRGAPIAPLARGDIDRHLAQKRHSEALGLPAAAPLAKDVVALSVAGTEEVAHVFDEPEHRH